ncbi:DNA-processing protein DprA [Dermacoccus sp. Ellin185]|uniref:DNA-processing protein DprA n=1 Tax=Dermacoccus sp. Ellin185 TaxID=188626 RepID=UPI0020C778A1|nr:DNA-processing protein DprA [Dermacoccus sp. Ellin185]
MATLTEQVQGERMAPIALSMIAEPNDPTTGYVLTRHCGIETLRLIESGNEVPGLARADVMMWRERLAMRITPGLPDQAAQAEGFGTLIPADKEWPTGLNDLGERAPYLLWTRGAVSFLTTALSDRATITGARAVTSYGEQVAGELATGLADEERVVISGGAYGIEGAAHKSVLAASGQTIAVLAGGLDRPYPAGHHELLNQIGDVGLLVSELPPGAASTRHRFLARHRLLAALSGATVIPEAGPGSGSMTTVIAAATRPRRRRGARPGD